MTKLLENKALDWFSQQNFDFLEKDLMQDRLFESPIFLKMKQDFILSFQEVSEDQAGWLFLKSFNDFFLAEKNYIPCPLW